MPSSDDRIAGCDDPLGTVLALQFSAPGTVVDELGRT